MKTIKRVIAEMYEKQKSLPVLIRIPDECFIDWAQMGAREAQRWIPVEEELPEMNIRVLLKLNNGEIALGSLREDGFTLLLFGSTVSHWRPIERE